MSFVESSVNSFEDGLKYTPVAYFSLLEEVSARAAPIRHITEEFAYFGMEIVNDHVFALTFGQRTTIARHVFQANRFSIHFG